jgi:hypothetical protein
VSLSITGSEVKRIAPLVRGDTNNIVNVKIVDGGQEFDLSSFDFITVMVQPPVGESFLVIGEAYPSNTSLEIVDAVKGMLLLRVQGIGCTLVGAHKVSFQFWRYDVEGEQPSWADGTVTRISTARMNYDVLESLDPMSNAFDSEIADRYNSLFVLMAKVTEFQQNEDERDENEQARIAAEILRESTTQGIVEDATQLLNQVISIEQLCREWNTAISNLIAENVFDIQDLPSFATDLDLADLKADIVSELEDGTIVPKTVSPYVADGTAPTDTTKLWIDTGNNNVIKFYNGATWEATATATFG